jgi:nucleotide-binding universal stress UspA family protein
MPVAVADALAHVSTLAGRLEVTAEVSPLKPSIALLDASEGAACVVMGAGGRAPALGAFLDSTFLEVAAKAACPVVVVRQFPEIGVVRPGVVVGADGSEISSEAIGYAFAQADDRQLPLTVVHLLTSDLNTARVRAASTSELAAITEQEQARAAQEVAGWAEKYPDVRVNRHVLRGHPVKALVDHSRGAELLVVGSRGRGRFAGILLGSVSRGVLQHAHCPVAVVRTRTG